MDNALSIVTFSLRPEALQLLSWSSMVSTERVVWPVYGMDDARDLWYEYQFELNVNSMDNACYMTQFANKQRCLVNKYMLARKHTIR